MLVVPSGDAVEQILITLTGLLEPGDVIIEAGNSHYRDTERRQNFLSGKGIHLLGLGVSGGLVGARHGPSLMAGGSTVAWQRARPILETIAACTNGRPSAGYLGKGGAGHFIKTVHNGIEYAIMQILADIFEILSQGCGTPGEGIGKIFQTLNTGATAGFLIEASVHAASSKDEVGTGFLVDSVDDRADQKGTGYWAVEAAFDMGVAVPTIAAAVQFRSLSAGGRLSKDTPNETQREKSHHPLSTDDVILHIAPAVACAMASSFAQGFCLIGAAKYNFGAKIDLHHVARLWQSGCILRGEMINGIADSLKPGLECLDILRSEPFQPLVAEGIEPLRKLVTAALSAGLPVPGLSSAVGYIDALNRSRLSTRFIQLQRDYFGGHGIRRIGQNVLSHGPWHKGEDS